MRSKAADVEHLYQIVMYCEYIGQLESETTIYDRKDEHA